MPLALLIFASCSTSIGQAFRTRDKQKRLASGTGRTPNGRMSTSTARGTLLPSAMTWLQNSAAAPVESLPEIASSFVDLFSNRRFILTRCFPTVFLSVEFFFFQDACPQCSLPCTTIARVWFTQPLALPRNLVDNFAKPELASPGQTSLASKSAAATLVAAQLSMGMPSGTDAGVLPCDSYVTCTCSSMPEAAQYGLRDKAPRFH